MEEAPAKQKHVCWKQETVYISTGGRSNLTRYKAFEVMGRTELRNLIEMNYYEDGVIEHYKDRLEYDKPKMPVFTRAVEEGAIIVGISIEGNVMTMTYGHLCDLLKPERYIKMGKCTFNVTKDNFIWQRGYRCDQCFPKDPNNSICESCAMKCHKGHQLIPLPIEGPDTKAHMFCDCYTSFLCKCT